MSQVFREKPSGSFRHWAQNWNSAFASFAKFEPEICIIRFSELHPFNKPISAIFSIYIWKLYVSDIWYKIHSALIYVGWREEKKKKKYQSKTCVNVLRIIWWPDPPKIPQTWMMMMINKMMMMTKLCFDWPRRRGLILPVVLI